MNVNYLKQESVSLTVYAKFSLYTAKIEIIF